MEAIVDFHDSEELERYGYVYHHSATSRERCVRPFVRAYSGRFGVGYIYVTPINTRYAKLEYYVEPQNW